MKIYNLRLQNTPSNLKILSPFLEYINTNYSLTLIKLDDSLVESYFEYVLLYDNLNIFINFYKEYYYGYIKKDEISDYFYFTMEELTLFTEILDSTLNTGDLLNLKNFENKINESEYIKNEDMNNLKTDEYNSLVNKFFRDKVNIDIKNILRNLNAYISGEFILNIINKISYDGEEIDIYCIDDKCYIKLSTFFNNKCVENNGTIIDQSYWHLKLKINNIIFNIKMYSLTITLSILSFKYDGNNIIYNNSFLTKNTKICIENSNKDNDDTNVNSEDVIDLLYNCKKYSSLGYFIEGYVGDEMILW